MKHRIRAAGLLVQDNKLLLVKLEVDGKIFWVPPGGALEACDNSTTDTVCREVFEETGLKVTDVGPLVFVREFNEPSRQTYHVEQFYLVMDWEGELTTENLRGLDDEHLIKEVAWLSQSQLESVIVYPNSLRNEFWDKLGCAEIHATHLGVQVEGS